MKLYAKTFFAAAVWLISCAADAQVYKCVGENKKVVYSAEPCEDSSQAEEQLKIKPTSANSSAQNGGPVGHWVKESNPAMTAHLSGGGRFTMTDVTGQAMSGNWKSQDEGYVIDASFAGLDMKIKMKYVKEDDALFLSKPGFVDTLVKYRRR